MFKKENLLKYLSIVIVGIVFLSVFLFYNISSKHTEGQVFSLNEFTHHDNNVPVNNEQLNLLSETYEVEKIFVEIKGEVLNPDVYELEKGSIVKDLILLSGGLTEIGDTSNINQARELQNGECIIILSREDLLNMKKDSYEIMDINNFDELNLSSSNDGNLININSASKEQLKTLNGIGDGLAEAIINYRDENGKFKTIEDIKNVSRIGDKIFEKIKDKIKV